MFQFRWLLFLHYIISPVPASLGSKVVLRIRPARKIVRLQHREQETRTGREDGAVGREVSSGVDVALTITRAKIPLCWKFNIVGHMLFRNINFHQNNLLARNGNRR